MNRIHLWYCGSDRWSRRVEQQLIPWALKGLDLGPAALELGPGLGVTTRLLTTWVAALTAVEIDGALAARLGRTMAGQLRIVQGDATALPLPDRTFDSVVCFTMLHHLPSPGAQDRLFAEALRVLRSGGLFAGSDSLPSLRFRLYHVADTMTPVDPAVLPARLTGAGFTGVEVRSGRRAFRFRARRP